MHRSRSDIYSRWGKRVLDVLLSAMLLVLTAPLLMTIAALVHWRIGPPLLFRQQRPGLGGKPFCILKFRTMLDARDAQGRLLPDQDRLPPLGRLLRRFSLDEVPELINVLKGEMSLVGPRPLLMHYLPHYTKAQMRRHEIRPGITGWAQVNGRNALEWEERFKLDVWYLDNLCFSLDMKILLRTIWKAIRGEGISQPGHATARDFVNNI